MSRLGQTVRVSGPSAGAVGGGGGPSAHITFDNAAVALGNMMGFTANGNATWDWDDAGYFQPYGARANTLVDPAATVAIVPVAGRYRFTIHGEFSITAPNPANTSARAWISIEKDAAGATWENTEHRIVKLPDATAPGGSWDATWIGPLDANGCVAFYSANADDPVNDIFNGWMEIELLGSGGGLGLGATLKNLTAFTLNNGQATNVTLASVGYSGGLDFSNPNEITVTQQGLYVVCCGARIENITGDGVGYLAVEAAGVVTYDIPSLTSRCRLFVDVSQNRNAVSASYIMPFDPGDHLGLVVTQTSGGSRSIPAGLAYLSMFFYSPITGYAY